MTWHSLVISPADFGQVISSIRQMQGTLTSYKKDSDGIHLVWTTSQSFPGCLAVGRAS